jgi:CDP-glucose 4,6-dehydratase
VIDSAFWRDRRVLVTGHNGFKGAWLCLWLQALGARVCGVSLLHAPTAPSLYGLAGVEEGMEACFVCDVLHPNALAIAVEEARPEIIVHLAAQPLVRASFAAPAETFAVNALGTAALLDAVRGCETVRAVVVVTSDKCYAPHADGRPHVEEDPLGGDDPYSASKACAELVVAAYRDSFFSGAASPRVATARAGNVIGGGDFGDDRLLPDLFRAALAGEPLLLRNPDAVRPWQHVLSPLSGYLALAQALCDAPPPCDSSRVALPDSSRVALPDSSRVARAGSSQFARAWNFGPDPDDALPVRELVARVGELWPSPIDWRADERAHPPENPALRLDCTRARAELGWRPPLSLERGLALTVEWFRAYAAGEDVRAVTLGQIGKSPLSI